MSQRRRLLAIACIAALLAATLAPAPIWLVPAHHAASFWTPAPAPGSESPSSVDNLVADVTVSFSQLFQFVISPALLPTEAVGLIAAPFRSVPGSRAPPLA